MMESIKKPTLRFRADGTFKILQLTDLHIGTLTGSLSGRNMTALDLIDTLIAAEKPDLVAFTGDISTDGSNGHICRIWDKINAILEKHNTPYTMTYGNHESDAHTNRPQAIGDHLEKYPLSLFECGDPNMGTGNYAVPVLASGSDKTAWLLYSIDCHSSQFPFPYPDGHKETREWYTWPTQLKWIEKTQKAAQAEFGSVPAIVFNHVPLPEYDELWMFDGTVGGRWEKTWRPTLNSGLFALMYRLGDFRGIFAGHDHTNSFHGYMYGIMLAYGRAGGYQIACEDYYKRGGRVIVLGEKSGQIDDTYIVLHDGSRDEPVVSPPVFDRNCFYDCAFANGIPVTEAHRKLPEKDLSLWKLPFPSAE